MQEWSSSVEKKGRDRGSGIATQRGPPVELDYGYLLLLSEDEDPAIAEEMKKLVPVKGETGTCKPTSWHQGGYDVVFIEVNHEDAKHLVVRFGQVTKSDSHSLKLKYFANFLKFLKAADYVVDSVELAFIVPSSKMNTFHIAKHQVVSSDLLNAHTRYGTAPTEDASQMHENRWTQTKEQDQIHIYGLDMASMDYPEGI
jgi:hypothetical protein